ncbi:MAG TPA: chloride channel protein, partial [Rhizomicrobium sp.]|nr:chloride channel protein [Rhizomicrobium sp.]
MTDAATTTIAEPSPESSGDEAEPVRISLVMLSILALVVGIVTGFGAVLFRDLIGFIHNVLFLGQFSMHYDANLFTPANPWGPWIILVPVIGAVGVTFLVSNFAPEAKGHGVPEVMDAIYYKGGIIRPVVAVVKSLASAIAIGSGSAVGREGPIIQIGSALGSTMGQIIRMLPGQRIVLVAAGAGAGIAATFNTPIGGVMFAIELMMPEVSVRTFLPVAIATGTATFVGRFFLGTQPAFAVPALTPLSTDSHALLTLVLYAILGAITGLTATAFIRTLHFFEDHFDRIGNRYVRHMAGMLFVGILIYTLYYFLGHYYVEGVGYSTVQAIMSGHMTLAWLLLGLFVCKMLATSVSLGSGSSGGIFSPSLYMGATVGGGFAALVSMLGLPAEISIPSFAMLGMGAMVGGGTGAVMTAVTMIFEMTRDYDIVMPMILAVAMSVGVRRMLSRENIYTIKLQGRGHVIPKALHANMFLVQRAGDVMDKDVLILPAELSFDEFLRVQGQGKEAALRHVVVTRGDRVLGVLRV